MRLQLVFKIVNNYRCHTQLQSYVNFRYELCGRSLRDTRETHLPKVKSAMGQSTFKFAAGKERINLPKELQAKDLNLRTRKSKTFHYLLEQDRIQLKCNIEFFSIYIYISCYFCNQILPFSF